jgi:molybdate transport system substrate-binding protein
LWLGLFLAALLNACSASTGIAPTSAPAAATAPTADTAPTPASSPTNAAAVATPTAAPAAAGTTELIVFAAASLTDSFNEIGKSFETANPGTKVTFSYGGSNTLVAQITKGAPADVFASANNAQMDVAVKGGQIAADSPKPFARNRLIVILPVANPAKISTLTDLAKPGLKIILEDKAVPAGQYSLDFLDKASKDPTYGSTYKDNFLKNVVSYEQDVKAVVSKVSLGEGDAGIVYTTDVTPAVANKLGKIPIPDALNTIATYPIAPITASKHADLAQKFVSYVLGADGQAVLAKWGFIAPTATSTSAAGGNSTASASAALTGLVNTPMQLTADVLQTLPAEAVDVSFQGPNGQESHHFVGTRLAGVISQAGLKLNTSHKNDQLRKYLVFTGNDGYEIIIGWAEIDPNLGNAPILLAWEQDGKQLSDDKSAGPLRLVVPNDKFGARNTFGIVKIEVRDVDGGPRASAAPAATPLVPAYVTPTPGAVALGGLVAQPGLLTPTDLQKFPSETVDVSFQGPNGVEKHTYTGVRLQAVIDAAKVQVNAAHRSDLLCKYVLFTANDGYEALITYGEIATNFGAKPILLAWEQDGQPLTGQNGPIRLVVPGDGHGARYVTGVLHIEVRDVDSPPTAT